MLSSNPSDEPYDYAYGKFDSSWRQIDLIVNYDDGSIVEVSALRPQSWIDTNQFVVGSQIDISLPERSNLGRATVTLITDSPVVGEGDGELVITTYRTVHRVPILNVCLENGESICGTVDHRIWSDTHQEFRLLEELEPGEAVQTRFGPLKVVCSQLQSTHQRVYNFEVKGQHVYEISDSGILVHNTGQGCEKLAKELAERAVSKRLEGTVNEASSRVAKVVTRISNVGYPADIANAASRLGISLRGVKVVDNAASVTIGYAHRIRQGDINLLKNFLSNQGAKSGVVNSGVVINKELKAALIARANAGKTIAGGRVEIADKILGTFRIIFDKLD